jgi:hypothetical protein
MPASDVRIHAGIPEHAAICIRHDAYRGTDKDQLLPPTQLYASSRGLMACTFSQCIEGANGEIDIARPSAAQFHTTYLEGFAGPRVSP